MRWLHRARRVSDEVFVVSGDDARARGPFETSSEMWTKGSGALRRALAAFDRVGFPVYPARDAASEAAVMRSKKEFVGSSQTFFVTQLVWAAPELEAWVRRIREEKELADVPIHAGVCGHAARSTLLKLGRDEGPLRGAVPNEVLRGTVFDPTNLIREMAKAKAVQGVHAFCVGSVEKTFASLSSTLPQNVTHQ